MKIIRTTDIGNKSQSSVKPSRRREFDQKTQVKVKKDKK